MKGKIKSKSEIKALAQKVVDSLRPERLPFWQVQEVLRFAIELLDQEALEMAMPESTARQD